MIRFGDFDRPLSTRGLNAASVVGDQIRECGVVPDLVVCSPSKRTVSTLELAILPLFPSILVRFERRIYEATRMAHGRYSRDIQ